jgi:CHASE2 domain-containing sensor protein
MARLLQYGVMAVFVVCGLGTTSAAESPFALVLIDAKSEQELGAFPFERAITARGVRQLKSIGAKAVVLKFFFDQPRTATGDTSLAEAISVLPVALQARIDDTEAAPNQLPARFFVEGLNLGGSSVISGKSGWMPLPSLADRAAAVGFVDVASTSRVPVLESYQGRFVKSLYLCALEMAFDGQALIEPGKELTLAGRRIRLDAANSVPAEFPRVDALDYVPFHELLSNPAVAGKLKGKVVVLGYDGAKMHTLATPVGPRKAHRVFWHGLQSLWHQLN